MGRVKTRIRKLLLGEGGGRGRISILSIVTTQDLEEALELRDAISSIEGLYLRFDSLVVQNFTRVKRSNKLFEGLKELLLHCERIYSETEVTPFSALIPFIFEGEEEKVVKAVSYTHLTLPTN